MRPAPFLLGAIVATGLATGALARPDLAAAARTLVNTAASIRAKELVLISGKPADLELLENVAVEVRKLGAFPLIDIQSEKLSRRLYENTPPSFDSQADQFDLRLAEAIDAHIRLDYMDNPALFADVPPARAATFAKAQQPVMEALLKNNVRQVALGNGLYPTAARAKELGITQEQLATLFWDGVNTDYSRLQEVGQTVRQRIANGKQVRITNPNGTDLTFSIAARPVLVSDGVISPDDISRGGAACQVWLPAGEVYAAPVPGTAEGKVVYDRLVFQGKDITGLSLTFKAGKVTEMTARSGLEPLKALYDAAGSGKELFAFFDVGINPSVKAPANTRLLSWIPSGMVSVGIGANTWAGGDNTVGFDLSGHLPGSTLTIDGKTLVENGTLTP